MPKILLIDDKMDNLVTLSALLNNLMPGCAVIIAQSGIEGIEKARSELPDAILLDVRMPDVDGFETCRRLKSDETTKHIPVIMVTAIKTDPQSRIKGLEIGADAFLAKPIDQYELVSQVKVGLRIKKAEDALREERDSLERLVDERTVALKEGLESARDFLESVINAIADPVFVKDDKRRFVLVNEALCSIVGRPREGLLGEDGDDMFPEEEVAVCRKMDAAVLDTGEENVNEEFLSNLSTGEVRTIVMRKTRYIDPNGNHFLVGVIRDITERKQAEVLMSKSNALLTSVINQAPFAIHILEGEFSNINVVIENAESARIMGEVVEGRTGIDADTPEMFTTRFFSIDGKQEIPLSRMPSPRAFQGEVVTNKEFIFHHSNGTQIMVEVSASPVYDANNQIMAVAVVFQDITKRKKAEKEREQLTNQLTQSQKMEAVGTLAGGIAHDFNNILAIILGNVELAFDDIPDLNPAAENLEEIRRASIRAKEMVRQLLSFSRKSDRKRAPLNLVPIINESMKMLRTAIPSSVEFSVQISDEPCNIMGDAAQINQIMMNLTTNAAHAMAKEGGSLEVTLENIVLLEEKPCFNGVLSPGAYARLKMRDTGTGMAPETMARIFEPYYTTKDVGKGTGMGLSVIHGIMKGHLEVSGLRANSGKERTLRSIFPY